MQVGLADWTAVLPALTLIVSGLVVVGVDLFRDEHASRWPLTGLCLLGLAGTQYLLLERLITGAEPIEAFLGALVMDDLTALLSMAVAVATTFLVLISPRDLARRGVDGGEYYGLVMFCAAAMVLLVGSNDFVMVFVNLEILSLALYVLTGITRRNPRSNEAAVKYLVNGAFATGFLLFGMTLLYGATGTLRLAELGTALTTLESPLLLPGVGLLLVGLAFKVGAAPFHMWVPDVYEGAPTSITAYMSVAVKAAGFGVLVRILLVSLEGRPDLWADLFWWIAVGTMVIGNFLALRQDSVKRMLAYSSIAHTGYAMIGLAALQSTEGTISPDGASAVVFYLLAYTVMTFGAFAFLIYIGREVPHPQRTRPEWQDGEHIDDLAGLGRRRPWAAAAKTLYLVSLAGIPPTAGFVGKFFVFGVAVAQGHYVLAIIGVLASLVSIYYYLRPIVSMYFQPAIYEDDIPDASVGLVLGLSAIGTLALGVVPSILVFIAQRSIEALG